MISVTSRAARTAAFGLALLGSALGAAAQAVAYDSLSSAEGITGNQYGQCLAGTCGPSTTNLLTSASYIYPNNSVAQLTAVGDLVKFGPNSGILTEFDYGILLDTGFQGNLNVTGTLELYTTPNSGAVSIGLGTFNHFFSQPVASSQGQIVEVNAVFNTGINIAGLLAANSGNLYYALKLKTNSTPSHGFGVLLLDETAASPAPGSDVNITTSFQSTTTTPLCTTCDPTLGVKKLEAVDSGSFTPAVRFITTAVPEPSQYLMTFGGLAALGAFARRSKKAD